MSMSSVAEVAAAVLDGVASAWDRFTVEGFESLRAEWAERSVLAGRAVRVLDRDGSEQAAGECIGVDEIGRLLVKTHRGCRACGRR